MVDHSTIWYYLIIKAQPRYTRATLYCNRRRSNCLSLSFFLSSPMVTAPRMLSIFSSSASCVTATRRLACSLPLPTKTSASTQTRSKVEHSCGPTPLPVRVPGVKVANSSGYSMMRVNINEAWTATATRVGWSSKLKKRVEQDCQMLVREGGTDCKINRDRLSPLFCDRHAFETENSHTKA